MDGELPDSNNVYSTIYSPVDLKLTVRLLQEEFPDARVWIYRANELHVDSDTADFTGYPASEDRSPDFLFNGGLVGDEAQLIAKVESIFRRFSNAGVSLSIEAYGSTGDLICEYPSDRHA